MLISIKLTINMELNWVHNWLKIWADFIHGVYGSITLKQNCCVFSFCAGQGRNGSQGYQGARGRIGLSGDTGRPGATGPKGLLVSQFYNLWINIITTVNKSLYTFVYFILFYFILFYIKLLLQKIVNCLMFLL